ncbi:MAG: LptF/LptG family permease [Ancalomicrobiaceae bacterium]|nr:LptF/LptG family permease [Ancalomicrobiaceae bacterium]
MLALIERYILGRLIATSLMALAALAGVVWVTQALRDMNLVTARGQTILVFLELTLLALPFLLVVIAPFAVVIGGVFTLNGLNADSELVVISAAGGSRMRVAKPVMAACLAASLAMLAFTAYVAPAAQHLLRTEITKINVDLISNIARPGKFIEIEQGLTFHIRNRAGDGSLVGLMIDDQRDKDVGYTYVANRAVVVTTGGKALLIMRDGVVQRVAKSDGQLSIINFEAYGFDLSQLAAQNTVPTFRPSDRSMLELFELDPNSAEGQKNYSKYRGEIVDRLTQPLLPLAFGVILLMMLGDARTTRQDRGMAIFGTFALALLVRGAHFAAVSATVANASAIPLAFAVPLGVLAFGLVIHLTDRSLSLPRPVTRFLDAVYEAVMRMVRRFIPGNGVSGGTA